VPDHSTLSRRAETLEVPGPCPRSAGPIHLLVDRTGLRICGPGEWPVEKHGTQRRRSWRKLHIGVDAEIGQILAAKLTASEVDYGSQVEPLFDQILGPLASFTGDEAYDQTGIYDTIAKRYPDADVIVPPRSTAVLIETAESAPTQRKRHLQSIAEHGRTGWQKRSEYTRRALVEAAISRLKRVIGDALRSRTDWRRATEAAIAIAVHALNRMLELGRRSLSASHEGGLRVQAMRAQSDPCNTALLRFSSEAMPYRGVPAVDTSHGLPSIAPGLTKEWRICDKSGGEDQLSGRPFRPSP
jgi:hypothetical protein